MLGLKLNKLNISFLTDFDLANAGQVSYKGNCTHAYNPKELSNNGFAHRGVNLFDHSLSYFFHDIFQLLVGKVRHD